MIRKMVCKRGYIHKSAQGNANRNAMAQSRAVALSGGVFMNRILTGLLVPQLETMGLTVLLHRDTPPNDGCIAIGQAIIAGGSDM